MSDDRESVRISRATREWLESLEEEEVTHLRRLLALHEQLERTKSREWLENLREEDIHRLEKALTFYQRMESALWFNRWLVIVLFGAFIVAAQFGEAVSKLFGWIKGAFR